MVLLKRCLRVLLLIVLVVAAGRSQDRLDSYGAGISFGSSYSLADIKGSKDGPFARAFGRYFLQDFIGLEAGLGLGLLEAEDDKSKFFSSLFVPVDARLLIQPLQQGIISPYFFAGVGVMYFNPVDKHNIALTNNARGVYSKQTVLTPLGVGLQYFVADNTAVELSGSYNYALTDYIDDQKVGSGNDAYLGIMLSVFAYLRPPKRPVELGRPPIVAPVTADSDGDGLTDADELNIYLKTLIEGKEIKEVLEEGRFRAYFIDKGESKHPLM